jgi:hypothetical protein
LSGKIRNVKKKFGQTAVAAVLLLFIFINNTFSYENFKTAVYCTKNDVMKLSDKSYFQKSLEILQKYIHIDKVYLEVHRQKTNDLQTMLKVKKYFEDAGIETAAGITTTAPRKKTSRFSVLCYSDKQQVDMLLNAVDIAARGFDECILDDFFFTSCKCEKCIKAKGDMSWTEFRLKKMSEISENLVKRAKKVNPKIKMVIKYPNWYAYYQYTGYNLATEPKIFDGIYTGTETRDPVYTHQNLQPYQSYSIMRYLENTAPGRNGGGWVDPWLRGDFDRYKQQLALTLFAGGREITLFHWEALFEQLPDGRFVSEVSAAAGTTFENVDAFAEGLNETIGLAFYKPHNSSGENFIASYLGMLGIPIELTPVFPDIGKKIVFLAESAAADKEILSKMESLLKNGGNVVITSGFLNKMFHKGIDRFVSAELKGYADISRTSNLYFSRIYNLPRTISIPIVETPTNDCWKDITGLSAGGNSYPLLSSTNYADGNVYILTIPDDYSDLYALPKESLYAVKKMILKEQDVIIEAPAGISLFLYKNNKVIVQSFLEHSALASLHFKKDVKLTDFMSGKEIKAYKKNGKTVFDIPIRANQYRVFLYK